jgi:hypothetical protein
MCTLAIELGYAYWVDVGEPYKPCVLACSVLLNNSGTTAVQRIDVALTPGKDDVLLSSPFGFLSQLLAGDCVSIPVRLSSMSRQLTLTVDVTFQNTSDTQEMTVNQVLLIPGGRDVGRTPRRLFVSYASADYPCILRLLPELRSRSDVWIAERDLRPTDWFGTEIRLAITIADVFLLFLSSSSVKSRWVQDEIRLAAGALDRDELNGVVAVRLEPCTVPEELSHCPVVDCYGSLEERRRSLGDAVEQAFAAAK